VRESVRRRMLTLVEKERSAALMKHGSLKGGMRRWIHHLQEECEEAVAEMEAISRHRVCAPSDPDVDTKNKLVVELAQVAQLAEGMIMMLVDGREFEGEETWDSSSR
jgi:hypothetical protein